MKRSALLLMAFWLCGIPTASAHLSNPSTLELKENSPRRFQMVLTLPIVDGRFIKARPVLPDSCAVVGEPTERGTSFSVVRTWEMDCDPRELIGLPIGMSGLLGTSQEVMLTIETLDGRKQTQVLRPTQPFFVIPAPPKVWHIVGEALWEGARRVMLRPELGLLIVLIVLLNIGARPLTAGLFAFVSAQALGQWLGGQTWMAVSPFLPRAMMALLGLLFAVELVSGQPLLRRGWLKPWWAVMLGLGLLAGAAQPDTIPTLGLSNAEQGMGFAFFSLGVLVGLTVPALASHEWQTLTNRLSGRFRDRFTRWISYMIGVAAAGVLLYQASAPLFGGGVTPSVPALTLVTTAVFGLWCRMQGVRWIAVLGGLCFGAGMVLSFQGMTLPFLTLALFSTLIFLGATLMWPRQLPMLVTVPVAVVAMFYHGCYVGEVLYVNTSLPVANATATVALVAFLFFAFYSAAEEGRPGRVVRAMGAITVLLALVWRLIEYRGWIGGPVASEMAMGLIRMPVLTILLLLAAGLAWPRRLRFQSQPITKPWLHWVLLAASFFLLPHGDWLVRNPFYTPRAPTTIEAKRIMTTLLSDTYLAFNVVDENDAFDRLAQNVSRDLVANVYLDSRRRLTAGTRKGAEVTVKDVSVMSVNDPVGVATGDQAFTYPCKWIVTARVKHWQHIHDRQNVYVGELTIRIEDERWKIARLNLLSEERVILSGQTS
jgi:hypothetical protein